MRSYGWRPQATRAAAPRAALRDSAIRIATTSAPSARSRAVLLGSVWLGALAMLAPNTAHAVDGTWTGITSAEWTVGTNWSSTPPNTVPDDIATFANSARTSVTISSSASINTIKFTAAAPAYSFTINGATFSINGAGISNSSAFAPSFTNNFLMFFNSGRAANAAITNNGAVSFLNASSAGSSTIINSGSGSLISFSDTSTANNATITTNGGALTQFTANSNGGNARFVTNAGGTVDFSGSSGPLGDGNISAGSIEGAGTYSLARTGSSSAATIFRPR